MSSRPAYFEAFFLWLALWTFKPLPVSGIFTLRFGFSLGGWLRQFFPLFPSWASPSVPGPHPPLEFGRSGFRHLKSPEVHYFLILLKAWVMCGFLCSVWIFFFNLFILFLAELGLHCCAQVFSSCCGRGLLFVVMRGLLIAVASLCCGARALGMWASVVVARGLSSCGPRA